jgi:hypothetical protein
VLVCERADADRLAPAQDAVERDATGPVDAREVGSSTTTIRASTTPGPKLRQRSRPGDARAEHAVPDVRAGPAARPWASG